MEQPVPSPAWETYTKFLPCAQLIHELNRGGDMISQEGIVSALTGLCILVLDVLARVLLNPCCSSEIRFFFQRFQESVHQFLPIIVIISDRNYISNNDHDESNSAPSCLCCVVVKSGFHAALLQKPREAWHAHMCGVWIAGDEERCRRAQRGSRPPPHLQLSCAGQAFAQES